MELLIVLIMYVLISVVTIDLLIARIRRLEQLLTDIQSSIHSAIEEMEMDKESRE